MKNLFIIDDEKSICNVLKFAFENDYNTYVANNMQEFDNIINMNKPDIVLLDLKLGAISGLDVLRKIKSIYEETVVIIMTAYGSIETSIQAIKEGAYDYILKPIELEELRKLIKNSVKYQDMQKKIIINNTSILENLDIVGKSDGVYKIFESIRKVKDLNVNILILGESGTGKELVAKHIHYNSIRKNMPFQIINCAAIPQNLLESELFGYEKGAFTGADKSKKGAFEIADKGSIFLDEIGEMDTSCQAKVLRAIQQKEITPLGSNEKKTIDIRIIAATNRNLEKEIENGNFRSDLYYRLCVFPIHMPSLRDRKQDIPDLVESFINKSNSMYGLTIKGMTNAALDQLKNMEYKGNIRELENIIHRACIVCNDNFIDQKDVISEVSTSSKNNFNEFIPIKLGTSLENAEKELIIKTLSYVNGNKAKAAKILRISERSLYYKLRSYAEDI